MRVEAHEHGARLMRLRGGKKEVKGKKIKQPRKLSAIKQKDEASEAQESDFFSTSLSFEPPMGGGDPAASNKQTNTDMLMLERAANTERGDDAQMHDDSSTGVGGKDAEAVAGSKEASQRRPTKEKKEVGVKVFAAQSARRRPREDTFDKALYDEMAAYQEPQKIFFAPAPKTLGQKMDDQAAAGWKTPKESPKQRVLREKAERLARREARGLKGKSVSGVAVEEGGQGGDRDFDDDVALGKTKDKTKTDKKDKSKKDKSKKGKRDEKAAPVAGREAELYQDRMTDKGFGQRTADYNDGEAFETRVGTSSVQDNVFYIPKHLEEEFVKSGDPYGAVDKRQAQEHHEIKIQKAEKSVEKAALKKLRKEQETKIRGSAVVFVGHIPAGFYEEAQFQFFSQYGKVLRLRLSRDKATSKYRGFGWVEFEDAAVANQVCKEMNGYVMYGKSLRVHMVRPDKLHADLFRNCHRKFVKIDWNRVDAKRRKKSAIKRAAIPEEEIKYQRKLIKKEEAKNRRLKGVKLAGQSFLKMGWDLDTEAIDTSKARI